MVCLSGIFQRTNKSYQLFGGMRDGDIVVFALGAFLGKIGSEGRLPKADVFGGVVKSNAP